MIEILFFFVWKLLFIMLWFLGNYTSKKAVGFFQKSLYIIWDTTLTQRELLCVWNTFNHDPTRFFFHPLRNVITHSLDLSSREKEKNTHTTTYYKCHQLAAFQCWYPFPYGYLSFTPSESPFNLPWRGFKHWRRRTTDV